MMTIEELEEKMTELEKLQAETENLHAKLKAQIAELKAQREEPPIPPHKRPEMNRGEKNYYINFYGGTSSSMWLNTEWDLWRLHIGNVFLTEEAAKYAEEFIKVLDEMREWAGQYNDPWKLISDGKIVDVSPLYNSDVLSGEMRFATLYDARNCIKAVGEDRLIKYYFGVRDHEIPAETE